MTRHAQPPLRLVTLWALLLPMLLTTACSDSHSSADGAVPDSGSADSGSADSGGAIPRWQRCSVNSDCAVVAVSCCGSCGQPSPSDMIGVNQGRVADYRGGRCDTVDCPACFMEPDPNLIATCSAGRCEAIDVRAHDVSACAADTDCSLRVPTCCGCSSAAPIAIRAGGELDFTSLVCDGDEACPECFPAFEGWDASCQMGHCEAVASPIVMP